MSYFHVNDFPSPDAVGCNITLNVTDTRQYIATEGYPDEYRDNENCSFNFAAPSGRNIVIFFEDFDLEEDFDYLHFRKSNYITHYANTNHRQGS